MNQLKIETSEALYKLPGALKIRYKLVQKCSSDKILCVEINRGFDASFDEWGLWFPVKDHDPWGAAATLERMGYFIGLADGDTWCMYKFSNPDGWLHEIHWIDQFGEPHDFPWDAIELVANIAIVRATQLDPEAWDKALGV